MGYHDKVHHLLPLLVLLALLVAYVSARSACDATVANSGRRAANEGEIASAPCTLRKNRLIYIIWKETES